MAAGSLRGTLTLQSASTVGSNIATGSVVVSAGDLIFVAVGEQNAITCTGVTDNLGNTYSAVNAGTDAGNTTLRCFFAYNGTAGTLTDVTVAATASGNNIVIPVAVIEGPIEASSLDANPANGTDSGSPWVCPATGALVQSNEIVMCAMSVNSAAAVSATSPNLLAIHEAGQSPSTAIGYQLVASAASVTPEFTSGAGSQGAQTTASFKLQGVTAYTLTAAVGSFVLTGIASLKKQTMLSSVGSFILSGLATLQKISMLASVGAFTLTGISNAMFKGYTLVAAAGAFTLTGIDATLQAIRTMAADVGAFTLTGLATLQKISMLASLGTFTFTGIDVIFQAVRKLTADVGTFTLTGVNAILAWGRYMTADAGSFIVTGLATLQKISMRASVGTFTLTGVNATLQAIRTMIASAGTFVFTGISAIIGTSRTLVAAAGSFVLTGVRAMMAAGALSLRYRVKRVVNPILAKLRTIEPVLRLTRSENPKLRKTRTSDPSLSQ